MLPSEGRSAEAHQGLNQTPTQMPPPSIVNGAVAPMNPLLFVPARQPQPVLARPASWVRAANGWQWKTEHACMIAPYC